MVDLDHVSTEVEFITATLALPTLKRAINEEEDPIKRTNLVIELGKSVVSIYSFMYNLSLEETIGFADWVSVYMNFINSTRDIREEGLSRAKLAEKVKQLEQIYKAEEDA